MPVSRLSPPDLIRWLAAGAFAVLVALALPGASVAATEQAALSPDDSATVQRVLRYLNGLSTVRARFVQISSNGAYAEGRVLVARPGKLRFDYDPPHPVLLIADGTTLLFYDRELKQASYLPLWETPLWFLIRERVTLAENMRVLRVEQGQGALRITLRDADVPDVGTVTLVFSDRPLALRKWEVVDAQGILTEVALINPRFDAAIDPEAFEFGDLDIRTGPDLRPER